ncbi:hypothetical protein Ssi02_63310 [Sinosporangium siamense]|uniref:Uncharacterized protein n=1 Tax=Sinosporangium siamense TaxID=1367973 RepID=A0A919RLP5_9ACTN|nr:hypothetical protein Ssi02_63310 [Sinosporangium siamense]
MKAFLWFEGKVEEQLRRGRSAGLEPGQDLVEATHGAGVHQVAGTLPERDGGTDVEWAMFTIYRFFPTRYVDHEARVASMT